MVKAENNNEQSVEPRFYKADVKKLKESISTTGKYNTEIATAGGLSKEVLARALKGFRITKAKADGICNGLNESGCKPKASREVLFPYGE
jgi:hypothetical protein